MAVNQEVATTILELDSDTLPALLALIDATLGLTVGEAGVMASTMKPNSLLTIPKRKTTPCSLMGACRSPRKIDWRPVGDTFLPLPAAQVG